MDRRTATAAANARKRRLWTLAVIAVAVIAIGVLIRYEQVALLYVLATLGVTSLLVIVALADFGEARAIVQPAPFDDAAAIGNATRPTAPVAPTSR